MLHCWHMHASPGKGLLVESCILRCFSEIFILLLKALGFLQRLLCIAGDLLLHRSQVAHVLGELSQGGLSILLALSQEVFTVWTCCHPCSTNPNQALLRATSMLCSLMKQGA